jgi:hypothetical protein
MSSPQKKTAPVGRSRFQPNTTPDQSAFADYTRAYDTIVNTHPSDELSAMRKLYLLASIAAETGRHRGVPLENILETVDGMCCSARNGLPALVRQEVFLDLKRHLCGAGVMH